MVWTLGCRNGIHYVIHVAGPKGRNPKRKEMLRGAVLLALRQAEELQCKSVALPAISSGIFGYPLDECTQVIAQSGVEFAKTNPLYLREIVFVNIDAKTASAMTGALRSVPN